MAFVALDDDNKGGRGSKNRKGSNEANSIDRARRSLITVGSGERNADSQFSMQIGSIGRSYHAKIAKELIKYEQEQKQGGSNHDSAFSPNKSSSFRKLKADSRLAKSKDKQGGSNGGAPSTMNFPILHYVDTISETEEVQS